MKKILLALVAVFMVSVNAMAGLDIKVTKGDKKFFKTAQGGAIVEFVWDGATYDKKEPLGNHFGNLKELMNVAMEGFTDTFNDKCKKVKVVGSKDEAQYKFTMKIENMDQYYKVMGFIPGNATKVWGVMTITDIQTGEELVVIDVNEVDGGANPNPTGSFSDCFEELAEQVAKLK